VARRSLAQHNSTWTAKELQRLRQLARQRLSARLAAAELGRTTGAVKYKAMVEGIRFQSIEQPIGVQKRLARRKRRLAKR
jgi:hypothetical protein